MKIFENINKGNLHHAYLIEGAQEEIVPEVLEFVTNLGIKTLGNQDFCQITFDSLKVEDARHLKSLAKEKGISSDKRVFLISANNILLEAQNTLLKMFEEPVENTHFFLIVPDRDVLLSTFASRFYFIKRSGEVELKEAKKFISSPLPDRINFIKELLAEPEAEEEEVISLNSAKSRVLKFLNALELSLHDKFLKNPSLLGTSFSHIFKVRKFLRQPGSSAKSLMESVALLIPNF